MVSHEYHTGIQLLISEASAEPCIIIYNLMHINYAY